MQQNKTQQMCWTWPTMQGIFQYMAGEVWVLNIVLSLQQNLI